MTDPYARLAALYDGFAADPGIAVFYKTWREALKAAARERGLHLRVIADIACGTGNSTVPWTRERGVRGVIGVDRSAAMLNVARTKSSDVLWLRQDIRRFRLDVQADAVTCHFDALNHLLTEDDLGAALDRVAAALRPGGLFQFDLNTVHWLRWLHDREKLFDVGPHCFMASNVYDAASGVATFRQTWFVKQGRLFERVNVSVNERAFDDATVRRLLREAGLRLERAVVQVPIEGKPARKLYLASKPAERRARRGT